MYFNNNTKQYTVGVFVLHKTSRVAKTTGNLIIQTTGNNGISLKPSVSEVIEMNGNKVLTTIYYLTNKDLQELKTYTLKTISFKINGELIGMKVTQDMDSLIKEFNCLTK